MQIIFTRFFIIISFLGLIFKSYSQTPGNVSNNLKLWLKSDVGVTTVSGGQITQWTSQAVNSNITTQAAKPATTHVVFQDNKFNYNPAVVYDGTPFEELRGIGNATDFTGQLTAYSIADYTGPAFIDGYHLTCIIALDRKGISLNETSYLADGHGTTPSTTSNTTPGTVNGSQLISVEYQTDNTSNTSIFRNGHLDENYTSSGINAPVSDTFEIGGRMALGWHSRIMVGNIGEVVVYHGLHTQTEREKIESYLSLKHGLTLDHSSISAYLNSAGTSVFADATGNSWNDVIGIGKDDNTALLQKQSHQRDDSTRLYISTLQATNQANTGSFSADNQYVVIGRNTDVLDGGFPSTEYPVGQGILKRVSREWKVVNTNFNGSFSMDVTSTIGSGVNASDLRLLVDDDGNFSNATVYAPTFSYAGGVVTATGIANTMIPANSTKYVTIARVCNLPAPTVTVTQPTCTSAKGTLTVTAPLGAGLSYSIDGITYTNTTGIFTNVSPGTYTVTVRNSTGCTSTGTVVIVNSAPPTPSAPVVTITQPTCTTATGALTVTAPLGAGLSYSIDGLNYSNTTGIFTGLAAGTYNVSVKNSAGCISAVTSVIITAVSLPSAPVVTITQPTCSVSTGSITITAPLGAGLSYSINGTTYTNTTGIFTGVAPGSYSVTVQNSAGCISTVTAAVINSVTVPAAPTVSVIQPTCTQTTGNITVTSPIGSGLSYSIDGVDYSNTTGVFSSLPAGNYSVTVKNAAGCISTATAVIITAANVPASPTVNVTQPTCIVATGSITITAPLGAGLSYSINGVDYTNTTGIFTTLSSGSYSVTVKSADGCISTATTVLINSVTVPAMPTLTVTPPTCALATGSINITSPLGAGFSYSIDGVNYNNTTGVFAGLNSGTYNVTVKSADGCISTAVTVIINSINVPAAPVAVVTQLTSCTLSSGIITVTSPLGAGYSYSIDGVDYSNTTGVFTGLAAGTYNVTVKSIDGCISPATQVTMSSLNAPAAPTVTVTQPTCTTTTGFITITSPLAAGNSFSIDGVDYSNTTGLFANLAPGTYNVTVKNIDGCVSTVTVAIINTVTTPAAPVVVVSQPTCAILTGSVTVSSPLGAGFSYSIDGVDYSNTSGIFTALAAGSYSVTVKNSDGCISSGTAVVINSISLPAAPVIIIAQPTCAQPLGTVTITSPMGTGLSYSINGIDYSNTTGVFSGLSAGTYNVTVKNTDGCVSAVTVATINVPPSLSLSLTATPTIIQPGGQTVNFVVTGNLPFTVTGWQPTSVFTNQTAASQNVFVNLPGPYSVSGITADGCADTSKILLTIPSIKDIYIPNTFTPNGDGRNDVFYVYGHSISRLSMKIFNQWGEMIFASSDQSKGWDGSYKGKLQSTTVFVYTVVATFLDGTDVFKKGTILLIR